MTNKNKENDEQSFKNNVNSSLNIFSVGMLIFLIIKTIASYTSAGSSNEVISTLRTVSTFIIVILFFLFSLFTNISITGEKMICGKSNYSIAFYATIIPFIFIYSIGIFSISIFPGWIRCFSNTFGSSILQLCGLESYIVTELTSTNTGTGNEVYKLYKDTPQILLNEIEIDVNGEISKKSKEEFYNLSIKIEDDNNKKLLKQYIYCKESIGEVIWHYLLGMITLLVSFNTILVENCNTFAFERDEFQKYLNAKLSDPTTMTQNINKIETSIPV